MAALISRISFDGHKYIINRATTAQLLVIKPEEKENHLPYVGKKKKNQVLFILLTNQVVKPAIYPTHNFDRLSIDNRTQYKVMF